VSKRFPIYDVEPAVYFGDEFVAAKAVVDETISVRASATREGHDALGVQVVLVDPKGKEVSRSLMREIWPGMDRYEGFIKPTSLGNWSFHIEAFDDPFHTWEHDCGIKIRAGIDEELCCQMGVQVFEFALQSNANELDGKARKELERAVKTLSDTKQSALTRFEAVTSDEIKAIFTKTPTRRYIAKSGAYPIYVERERALYSAWYEFFPRSEGAIKNKDGSLTSGNFKTAIKSLERVAKMGFDVLYLPPIHPIGKTFRKGANNSLTPSETDPGVPWAIGSKAGGHDAINPELGTLKDFEDFVKAAHKLDIEIALDFALQVSPDHPWVAAHPDWFTIRPDGSIAYAENPPKKYQDIYPINFDKDYLGIKKEVVRVLKFWIEKGVKIFRVDNPHTKPVIFWQEVIAEINSEYPEVIFLAEAFTRPAMMHSLGKAGFQQSYTYFTWRTSKEELTDYATEVAKSSSAFFRPNFWVNTPDILPFHLQNGNPAMFALRAMLAATLSPSWGMYAGYELYEHIRLKEGGEEYKDSEKYEIKVRDWAAAEKLGMTLAPFIAQLNSVRDKNPALQELRNLEFHATDSGAIIAYSKRSGDNLILVTVNLDPSKVQETMVHWNMFALGLPEGSFKVTDLLTGQKMEWSDHTFVRLDPARPHGTVGHIVKVLL
jgi:starch synthase (maltosyl-transferring)